MKGSKSELPEVTTGEEPTSSETSPEHEQHANDIPAENGADPESNEAADNGNDDEMNPYERALKDNEKHKKRFVDELKREAEERKKAKKEEEEAQA